MRPELKTILNSPSAMAFYNTINMPIFFKNLQTGSSSIHGDSAFVYAPIVMDMNCFAPTS